MSDHLSGQQQHHQDQLHEINDLDLDIDIDYDSTDSIDDDAASTDSIGPPPVTYMANMIANHLMPQGASMFGRREDASCILKVGQTRYYVHVQMLASRSPTFRRIFDDMIRNEAWGTSSDTASSSESMAIYEDGQYDSDDESMEGRQSFESNPEEQGVTGDHADHESQTRVQQSSDDLLSSMVTENLQLRSTEHDSNNLNIDVRRSFRSRDGHGSEQDNGDDPDDIDDYLPELTVTFEDPDGDHFKELLHWLYTGDSERWLQSFTPENYQFILRNIVHLCIITSQVFDICLSYETTTGPDQGLRGMAMALFFAPPADGDTTQITNL